MQKFQRCLGICSKFLGVLIDDKLNWKMHINDISGKISRGIAIIVKARKLINTESLKCLYYSFIYPYLTYGNQIWGSTYKSNLEKIYVLQKKAMRIITGSPPRCHSEPLFKNLGLLKLEDINTYLIGMFMYRIYKGYVPSLLQGIFTSNEDYHNYSTRQACHLHLPLVHTDLGKFSIKYRGALVWNDILQSGISLDCSEPCFKKSLKRMFIEKYEDSSA